MGTFRHAITLISATGDKRETLEAVVDTGATFTNVPAPVLVRIGVQPEHAVRLRLANGQIQERPLGAVRADLDGKQMIIPCLFGDPAGHPIIGTTTLEIFLLAADPVEKRLVPTVGYWLHGKLP